MPIEDRLYVGGRTAEIARELHFLVPDLRHACEGPFEIAFHLIPHGVELETDLVETTGGVRGAHCAGTCNRHASRGQRFDELATFNVFHNSFRFIASTA